MCTGDQLRLVLGQRHRPRPDDCEGGSVSGARRWRPEHVRADGTNNGTGTATTAQVQDQLPTGLTFVSAGGTGWVCANASGLVTCDFSGSIAPSGTSTINVVVSASAGTAGQTLVNYASIDPTGGTSPPTPGPSCAPAASCASSSGNVSGPDLTIAKAAPSPGLVVGAQSRARTC